VTETDTFLARVHKLFLFFDYSVTDLEEVIKNRKKNNIKFLEKDLWTMISGLSHAINYFHFNKIFLNNLKSRRIFINQRGDFKITDPGLF